MSEDQQPQQEKRSVSGIRLDLEVDDVILLDQLECEPVKDPNGKTHDGHGHREDQEPQELSFDLQHQCVDRCIQQWVPGEPHESADRDAKPE